MAWHSARDRLDEPRACCFDGSGAGEGCPLVGRHPWRGHSAPRPQGEHLPNPRGETGRREGKDGEVAEWLKAHAWKVCLRETVTRVRIPLSPPVSSQLSEKAGFFNNVRPEIFCPVTLSWDSGVDLARRKSERLQRRGDYFYFRGVIRRASGGSSPAARTASSGRPSASPHQSV